MVHITRTEIMWIVNELEDSIRIYESVLRDDSSDANKALCQLKIEQLVSIRDRLKKAFANKDKRIAITIGGK